MSTQIRCAVPGVEEVGKATVCYYEDVCCPTGGGMLSASSHGGYGAGHQQQSTQQQYSSGSQQQSNSQYSNTNSYNTNGWESESNSHYVGGQQHEDKQEDSWGNIEWDLKPNNKAIQSQSEQQEDSYSSLNSRESAWLDSWNNNKESTTNTNQGFEKVTPQHSDEQHGGNGRVAGIFFAMMAIVVVLVYTAMFYKRNKESVATAASSVDQDLESREGGDETAIIVYRSGRRSRKKSETGSRRSRGPKQRTIYDDSDSYSDSDSSPDKSFDESNSSFSYQYEDEDVSYDGSSTLPSMPSNYGEKVAACV